MTSYALRAYMSMVTRNFTVVKLSRSAATAAKSFSGRCHQFLHAAQREETRPWKPA